MNFLTKVLLKLTTCKRLLNDWLPLSSIKLSCYCSLCLWTLIYYRICFFDKHNELIHMLTSIICRIKFHVSEFAVKNVAYLPIVIVSSRVIFVI